MISRSQILLLVILLAGISTLFIYPIFDHRIPAPFQFDNRSHHYEIRSLSIAADFNDWDPQRHLLSDPDGDDVWTATVPLKPGPHTYRFVLNHTRWLKDPENPNYTGPYSNSFIYVDTIDYPRLVSANPANGCWLYTPTDTASFLFDQDVSQQTNFKIDLKLDGSTQNYQVSKNSVSVVLPPLFEGEHQWQVHIINNRTDTVYEKSGIWYVNFKNQRPVAEAGYTQFAFLNQRVRLNGGRTFDPDLDGPLKVSWEQVYGPEKLIIIKPDSPFPEIHPEKPGRYRFILTTQDSSGALSRDETEVIVLNAEQPMTRFRFDPGSRKESITTVSLVGEFNQWNPETNPLRWRADSSFWEIEFPLPKGQYEYKFVLNGSDWIFDPDNAHKIEDGWQGFNSVKTVDPQFNFQPKFELDSIPERSGRHEIFVKNLPDAGSASWYADINNPAKSTLLNGNRLIFSKTNPPGIYYFYFVFKYNGRYTKPLTLLVNHFETTRFSDLSASPGWPDTSVVYEIFIRRFTKKGTFQALSDKLPFLRQMGVNVLWLMPVYEGPTDHGYAPTKLFDVERDYGNLSDYQQLIDTAHGLGMKVVFDFVANHLSDQHRFVQAAMDNLKSPLRDWFHWQPGGSWDYHNDWDTLVNLNFNNPQVRHVMLETGRFWLALGVDGFRCDVAWAVPHSFWKDFRRAIKEINPDCLIINEALPRQQAFHDDEFDMSYDTDFYGNMLDVLQEKKPLSALEYGFRKTLFNYPASAQALRYLENHDLERFVKLFGNKQTKLMAALLFTVPGTPLIYYGQESGLREMRPDYPERPDPKWFDFYTGLIKLRQRFDALTLGSMETVDLNNVRKVWHFRRVYRNEIVNVLINLSKQDQKVNVPENDPKILYNEKNLVRENSVYYLKAESMILYESGN